MEIVQAVKKLTLYGPYILESVVHDGFAFRDTGGFPYVKYGNNWHVKGKFNPARAIELSQTAYFVYNFVLKPYKRATSVAHLTNFSIEFFYAIFAQDAPLLFSIPW